VPGALPPTVAPGNCTARHLGRHLGQRSVESEADHGIPQQQQHDLSEEEMLWSQIVLVE
jgi:hypothetical protein